MISLVIPVRASRESSFLSPAYFYILKGLIEAPHNPHGNSLWMSWNQVPASLTVDSHWERGGVCSPACQRTASVLIHKTFPGSTLCRGGQFNMCEKIWSQKHEKRDWKGKDMAPFPWKAFSTLKRPSLPWFVLNHIMLYVEIYIICTATPFQKGCSVVSWASEHIESMYAIQSFPVGTPEHTKVFSCK